MRRRQDLHFHFIIVDPVTHTLTHRSPDGPAGKVKLQSIDMVPSVWFTVSLEEPLSDATGCELYTTELYPVQLTKHTLAVLISVRSHSHSILMQFMWMCTSAQNVAEPMYDNPMKEKPSRPLLCGRSWCM